jgi:zinc transporter ZupT
VFAGGVIIGMTFTHTIPET